MRPPDAMRVRGRSPWRAIDTLWALATLFLVLPPYASAQTTCVDRDCAATRMRGHLATQPGFWKNHLASPIEKRVGAAPAELLDYVQLDNLSAGLPEVPRSASIAPEFMRDLRHAFDQIPPAVKRLVSARLAGIYLVDNLGSTGYTDAIFDAEGKPLAGFIVLDAAVLQRFSANAWATWKENTPFAAAPGWLLKTTIETKRNDNRKNAIQYILLHELGHIASIGAAVHPYWGIAPAEVRDAAALPYFNLSWLIERQENRFISRFDAAFRERRDIAYYASPKLAATQMAATYGALAATNFPTLYAATSPGDDFAEAFAMYVHSVMMGKPFSIEISHEGATKLRYRSCWQHPRCADKRRIIESLLGTR